MVLFFPVFLLDFFTDDLFWTLYLAGEVCADPDGAAALLGAFLAPVFLLAIFLDPVAFFDFLATVDLLVGFVLPPIQKDINEICSIRKQIGYALTEIPVALSILMIGKINRSYGLSESRMSV